LGLELEEQILHITIQENLHFCVCREKSENISI
jgi:hypothetical protein